MGTAIALFTSSPAIDAGDPNALAGIDDIPEFDQRGTSFGRIVGPRIDVGAYEDQTPSADFDQDGDVDADDRDTWVSGFGMQGNTTFADGDTDGDRDVDGADFLVWQRTFTGSIYSESIDASQASDSNQSSEPDNLPNRHDTGTFNNLAVLARARLSGMNLPQFTRHHGAFGIRSITPLVTKCALTPSSSVHPDPKFIWPLRHPELE